MKFIYLFITLAGIATVTVAQLETFAFSNNEHINADEMLTITNINRIQCVRACQKEEFCFAINVEMQHDSNKHVVCKLQERVPYPAIYETGIGGSSFTRKHYLLCLLACLHIIIFHKVDYIMNLSLAF